MNNLLNISPEIKEKALELMRLGEELSVLTGRAVDVTVYGNGSNANHVTILDRDEYEDGKNIGFFMHSVYNDHIDTELIRRKPFEEIENV